MGNKPTYGALKKLTDEELIGLFDQLENVQVGASFYRNELALRETARLNKEMGENSRSMALMTVVVGFTFLNLLFVGISFFKTPSGLIETSESVAKNTREDAPKSMDTPDKLAEETKVKTVVSDKVEKASVTERKATEASKTPSKKHKTGKALKAEVAKDGAPAKVKKEAEPNTLSIDDLAPPGLYDL